MKTLIEISDLESVTTEVTFSGGIERAAYLNAEALAPYFDELIFVTNHWAKPFTQPNITVISTTKKELRNTLSRLPKAEGVICHCPSISIRNAVVERAPGPYLIYEHNRPGSWCSIASVRVLNKFPNWYTNSLVWNPIWEKLQRHFTPEEPIRFPKLLPVTYYDPEKVPMGSLGREIIFVGREERHKGLNTLAKRLEGLPMSLFLPHPPTKSIHPSIKVRINVPFDEINEIRANSGLNVSLCRLESFGLAVFESSVVGLPSVSLIGRNFANPYESHSPLTQVFNKMDDLIEYISKFTPTEELRQKVRNHPLLANFTLKSYQQSWLSAIESLV